MLDLFIGISRFIFIGLLGSFLYLSCIGFFAERNNKWSAIKRYIIYQRWITVIFHVLAFVIFIFRYSQNQIDIEILKIGGIGLLFLVFAWIITDKVFANGDSFLWNSILLLIDLGIVILQRLDPILAQKQLLWVLIGLVGALIIPLFFKFLPQFEKLEKVYLIAGWSLLLATFILGKEKYGATNWIVIGQISFQPSEIVKFLFIFYLASVFRKKLDLRQLLFPSIMSAGYILVLVVQRDLGGALIYFMTYLVMIYLSTSNEILFLGGLGMASFASMIAFKLFRHVQIRVEVWLNPWKDIDKTGYQIVQSLFAIGTWGWLGSGLTKGYAGYVPAVTTDFIFAAICEEFGNIFSIGIILTFGYVFFRGVIIALRCQRRFYSLLAAGFTNMMCFQTFLILGGVIKLIPLTGVTLPFVSYGGTSVIVSIMMIGMLQWIRDFYDKQNEGGEIIA